MALYLVRRTLPGTGTDDLVAATQRVRDEADEPTSAGVTVSDFATQYRGCAGPLRSMIASGALDGVRPAT